MRYVRVCTTDGRINQPDIQEAIRIRRAFALSGGYPEQERRLSKATRDAVIERDRGCCVKCGDPEANQIDHIKGGSPALENLQLLCRKCHNQKTISGFVPVPTDDLDTMTLAHELDDRIESPEPLRLCDSEYWGTLWRKVRAGRKRLTQQPKEKATRKRMIQQSDQQASAASAAPPTPPIPDEGPWHPPYHPPYFAEAQSQSLQSKKVRSTRRSLPPANEDHDNDDGAGDYLCDDNN